MSKAPPLNSDQRTSISRIFEALLSEKFNEKSYRAYSLTAMKDESKRYVNERLRLVKSPEPAIVRKITSALGKIQRAKTREDLLMLISDAALIDTELVD